MTSGSVHYNGERLTSADIRDIVKGLQSDVIRILALRKCRLSDKGFSQICNAVGTTKSLYQLNINVGLLTNVVRAESLAQALERNRSLTSLFLHGSTCGEIGIVRVLIALATHPKVTTLDIGDCHLTDNSVTHIAKLLTTNGAKQGLKELTMSANKSITFLGWSILFVAMAASTTIHTCHLDYNNIGDQGAACLAVVLVSNSSLRVVDLESCLVTESGAQALLYLVTNYAVSVKELVLEDNSVSPMTKDGIYNLLRDDDDSRSESSSSSEESSEADEEDSEESEESSSHTEVISRSHETYAGRPSYNVQGTTDTTPPESPKQLQDKLESHDVDSHSISSSSTVISKYIRAKDFKRAQSDTETEKSMPVEIIALRGRPEFMDSDSEKYYNRKASKISFGDAKTYAIISQNQSLTPIRRRSVKIQTDLPLPVTPSTGRTPSHTSRSSHSETSACLPIMISHRD